jgi:hypothetical protein
MKMTLAGLAVGLLLCASVMAENNKIDHTASNDASKVETMATDGMGGASNAQAEMVKRSALNPEIPIPKSYNTQNALLMAALWTATAMDIQSSSRLDPTRYHEVNRFGGPGGQIATSLAATGAAILIQRYEGKRARWLSSALLAGGGRGGTCLRCGSQSFIEIGAKGTDPCGPWRTGWYTILPTERAKSSRAPNGLLKSFYT